MVVFMIRKTMTIERIRNKAMFNLESKISITPKIGTKNNTMMKRVKIREVRTIK